MRRTATLVSAIVAAVVAAPLTALADPLEPFLQRSATAEFTGEQVVSCETPDGSRTVAIEISQADGVTTARSAVGGDREVRLAGGSFAMTSDDGVVGTTAALSAAVPTGLYTVSQVKNVELVDRNAQQVTVVDRAGDVRASMTFDVATGALLAARIRNADETIYCDIQMVEFSAEAPNVDSPSAQASTSRLEPVDSPDDARLPEDIGAFARLETYNWNKGGVIAYYSDGLFSFALIASDRPVVLDDSTAETVEVDGSEYVRWFGAGQVIYVWETTEGGLTMYGDLPLDMQSDVLAALPAPERQGVLARWWRSIFG